MMRDQRQLRRAAAVLALSCGSAWLGSCQNDNPSRPPIEIVTPQPVRGVIAQASFADFKPRGWVALPIPITQRGVLDITVDWQYPDSWIYVYFGNTSCGYDELVGKACPFLIASETQLPKPREIVTGSLDPGTYYVFFYNAPKEDRSDVIGSFNVETVSVQIGLTVAASSRGGGELRLGRPTVLLPPHP
jgi:hypothetical protein